MSGITLQNATSRRGGWGGGGGGGITPGTDNFFPYWLAGSLTATSQLKNVSGNLTFTLATVDPTYTIEASTTAKKPTIAFSNSADAKSSSIVFDPATNTLRSSAVGLELFESTNSSVLRLDNTGLKYTGGNFTVARTGLTPTQVFLTAGTSSVAVAITLSNSADAKTAGIVFDPQTDIIAMSGDRVQLRTGVSTSFLDLQTANLIYTGGDFTVTKSGLSYTQMSLIATTTAVSVSLNLRNTTDGVGGTILLDPSTAILSVNANRVQLKTGLATSFLDLQASSLTYTGGNFTVTRSGGSSTQVFIEAQTTGITSGIVFNNSADLKSSSILYTPSTDILRIQGTGIDLVSGAAGSGSFVSIRSALLTYTGGNALFTRTTAATDIAFTLDNGTSGQLSTLILSNSAQSRSASISFAPNTNTLTVLSPLIQITGSGQVQIKGGPVQIVDVGILGSNLSSGNGLFTMTAADFTITRTVAATDTTLTIENGTSGRNSTITLSNSADGKMCQIYGGNLLNIESPSSMTLRSYNADILLRAKTELTFAFNNYDHYWKMNSSVGLFLYDSLNNQVSGFDYSGNLYFGPVGTDGTHRLVVNGSEIDFQKRVSGSYATDVGFFSSVGVGTGYTLTTTYAQVAFGTTTPQITLNRAGSYLVMVRAWVKAVASGSFTGKTNPGFWFKAYRNNNTPSDIANTENFISAQADDFVTGSTVVFGVVTHATVYTTLNTTDVLEIQGKMATTTAAGSFQVYSASLIAVRLR